MSDLQRRAWLRWMAAASLGAAGVSGFLSRALAKGDLPTTSGIHKLEGSATVNGAPAKAGTPVAFGDKVVTGPGSQAVVVMQGDAFLLRAGTTIEFQARDGVLASMRVATGKVLSVFSRKPVAIKAAHASIGIRGTGAYLEVEGTSVYFCLCYGEALIEGAGIAPRAVKTTHHEEPLLLDEKGGAMVVAPGPFRNHSDAELVMLEALVGREPPFTKDGQYPQNRY